MSSRGIRVLSDILLMPSTRSLTLLIGQVSRATSRSLILNSGVDQRDGLGTGRLH